MYHLKSWIASLGVLTLLLACPAAQAQWAVIDVGAIAQLVQQVQLLEQELTTAQRDLQQAEQAYRAITGDRGMEELLGGINRNYLPTSASQLQVLLSQGSTGYAGLAAAMQQNLTANAVLSNAQLGALPPQSGAQLQAMRRSTALLQALVGAALTTASNRFASLQQLIGAIGSASDEKAALDLQTRISAEQSMLQNDAEKLSVLFESALAQQQGVAEQAREQIVAGHGSFGSRFEPSP